VQINPNQLCAISNTQAVIFNRDPTECKDLKWLFNPKTKETQCKRLVGKNICMKVNFEQTIQAISTEACIVCIVFGQQSVILELDEGELTPEEKENM